MGNISNNKHGNVITSQTGAVDGWQLPLGIDIAGKALISDGSNAIWGTISTTDTYATGGTFSGNTLTIRRNDGNSFNVTGFTSSQTLAQTLAYGNTSDTYNILMGSGKYIGSNLGTGKIYLDDNVDGGDNNGIKIIGGDLTANYSTISASTTNCVLDFKGTEGKHSIVIANDNLIQIRQTESSGIESKFQVSTTDGFYYQQNQNGTSKGTSKTNFASLQTTNGTKTSIVAPFSGLEITDGAVGLKAIVTGIKSDNSKAYFGELICAVRLSGSTHNIINTIDKLEKSEFTTATSTIELVSGNLEIRVTGESATTIKWNVKYEIIYSV